MWQRVFQLLSNGKHCFNMAMSFLCCAHFIMCFGGCNSFFPRRNGPPPEFELPVNQVQNPLFIPQGDREFIWNQIVDELDNSFQIQREQRIHLESGILTEGFIETRPKVGSTLLEPWRTDSTSGYERWHATLQSIRRTARARVIPVENGYLLDLVVLKELEDVDKPVQASAGAIIQRHDSTLVREQVPPGTFSITPGWISLGRDISLEQTMLANLKSRLCDTTTPSVLKE
jgi:hypothetical protein